MRPSQSRAFRYLDLGFALILLGIIYVSFFPGILSVDARYQFGAVLNHNRDWHSPVMNIIWAGLNRLYIGSALMVLVIQAGLILGLWLLLRLTIGNPIVRCVCLAGLVLYPAVFPTFGYFMKDSFFCAMMTCGCAWSVLACSARSRQKNIFPALILAILFLFLAMATRPDGIAAVIPVLAWLGVNLITSSTRAHAVFSLSNSIIYSVVASTLLAIVLILTIRIINTLLCQGMRDYPEQVLMDHDLAGLSVDSHQVLFPPSLLASDRPLADLQRAYTASDSWGVLFPENAPVRHVQTNDHAHYRELLAAWVSAIRNHPLLYLKNRIASFVALLGLTGPLPETHQLSWSDYPNTYGNFGSFEQINAVFSPGLLIRLEVCTFDFIERLFLLRPVVYVALTLLCLGWQFRYPRWDRLSNQVSLMLSLSSLAHISGFLFCCPTSNLRFTLWTTLASLLSAIILGANYARVPRPEKGTGMLFQDRTHN